MVEASKALKLVHLKLSITAMKRGEIAAITGQSSSGVKNEICSSPLHRGNTQYVSNELLKCALLRNETQPVTASASKILRKFAEK